LAVVDSTIADECNCYFDAARHWLPQAKRTSMRQLAFACRAWAAVMSMNHELNHK